MMELFVLRDTDLPPRVVKINIDQETQKVVNGIFESAAKEFQENREPVSFSMSYKPDKDEYFLIEDFIEGVEIFDAIERPSAIQSWDPNTMSMHNVKAIFSGAPSENDDGFIAYIQYFDKRQIIDTQKSIFQLITQQTNQFSSLKGQGLTISGKLDAILLSNGKFMFNSFHLVRRFFDMSEYFSEATKEDIQQFISHSKFEMESEDSFMEAIDSRINTKIALINSSGILDKFSVDELQKCAQIINLELTIIGNKKDKKIFIPKEKKRIKQILNFLDQGYFNTLITNELMFANSKRKL